MIRKNYIKPVTDVVVISSVHIMASSTPEEDREYRGFATDGEFDSSNPDQKGNTLYNVWNQSDDEKYRNTFLEID